MDSKKLKKKLEKELSSSNIKITHDIDKMLNILAQTYSMIVRTDSELENHYNQHNSYLINGKRNPNIESRKNLTTTFNTYFKLYRELFKNNSNKENNNNVKNELTDFMNLKK